MVIDACYGASTPLLGALADALPHGNTLFVGKPSLVPEGGLFYERSFFAPGPAAQRAAAVSMPNAPTPTQVTIRADWVREAIETANAMDGNALQARLVRRKPPAVRVELPEGGAVLVPVARWRLRGFRPRMNWRPRGESDRKQ